MTGPSRMVCRGCAEARRFAVVPKPFFASVSGPCICCGQKHERRDLLVVEDWYDPQPNPVDGFREGLWAPPSKLPTPAS